MADIAIVKEWIAKAEEDFEFALVNLKEGRPFIAQICFHFHQSAEKYLKAYIIAEDLQFRKIHDLPALLKTCTSKDPSLNEIRDDCENLNTFYIDTRYPVHWPTDFSSKEAKKAFRSAEKIRNFIMKKLDIR